ncbi:hypothetical protein B484DRAFT_133798 [Ochromonadaceae sp. CCMP2298]|nr:hypothetical protein B484DRAFT_133798 [Ochromonadaceae sp. CCMP2298]
MGMGMGFHSVVCVFRFRAFLIIPFLLLLLPTEGQKLTALDISDSEDEGAEDEYYKHTAGGSGSIFSKKGAAAPAPTAAAGPVAAAAAAVAAPAVAASTAAAAAAPAAAPAASTPAPAPPTPASSAPAAVPVEGKRRRATPSK